MPEAAPERIPTPKDSLEGQSTVQVLTRLLLNATAERTASDDRISKERQAQTVAITEELQLQRRDFRIFGILMLGGILALAGINVAFKGYTLTSTPVSIPAPQDK